MVHNTIPCVLLVRVLFRVNWRYIGIEALDVVDLAALVKHESAEVPRHLRVEVHAVLLVELLEQGDKVDLLRLIQAFFPLLDLQSHHFGEKFGQCTLLLSRRHGLKCFQILPEEVLLDLFERLSLHEDLRDEAVLSRDVHVDALFRRSCFIATGLILKLVILLAAFLGHILERHCIKFICIQIVLMVQNVLPSLASKCVQTPRDDLQH